ncbi:cysteine hydrolase family protein [Rhodococcus sp. NPDC058505]|uniref:cysteine hydrolase family protein n=1 Tax=unclassified Rhodococcus (in: high G+C Gram-positive bacteria) TaxID=192944 RepID=UPI00365A91C5
MTDYLAPRWDRAALVVIDLQRDFLDGGHAAVPGTTNVVPNVSSLVRAFRLAGRPVVHVVRLYPPGGSDVDVLRRESIERGAEMAAPGTDGCQIADGILPPGYRLDEDLLLAGRSQAVGPNEIVLFKPRWSAFYRTELESLLRAQGCDTVVVAGCNLPNCPRATLFDASERDFRTVLVIDAVSQASAERVGDLDRIGVNLCATAEVVAALSAADRGR